MGIAHVLPNRTVLNQVRINPYVCNVHSLANLAEPKPVWHTERRTDCLHPLGGCGPYVAPAHKKNLSGEGDAQPQCALVTFPHHLLSFLSTIKQYALAPPEELKHKLTSSRQLVSLLVVVITDEGLVMVVVA